jgi:hypothetical protein
VAIKSVRLFGDPVLVPGATVEDFDKNSVDWSRTSKTP